MDVGGTAVIEVGEPEIVVPSPGLPGDSAPLAANNNLDACRRDGCTYLAWRTAPTHFASRRARLEVVAEEAPGRWRHETTVRLGRDVREPRFVVHDGRLLLYFFTAGVHPLRFEPDRIQLTERLPDGTWSPPRPVSAPDRVVWRVRPVDGRLVMSGYVDASGAYTTDRAPRTRFWSSGDGEHWEPMFDPGTFEPGTTETDFVVHDDGYLVVSRRESRGQGLGSVLAVLDGSGTVLRSRHEPRKFDSPALFDWHDRTFLVTRRQVLFGGRAAVVPPPVPDGWRDIANQLVYWATPKATAVYEIDRASLEVRHVRDLPGCADTAFASIVGGGDDGSVTVYNYSSPFWMGLAPWIAGQVLPTRIHRVRLSWRPPAQVPGGG